MRLLSALILLATPALAETPMTAEEFEALTLGRTVQWTRSGQLYATEHYLAGRQLQWAYPDEPCKTANWYPQGDAICFRYDPAADTVCWEMTRSETGFLARYTANPPDASPVEVTFTAKPLACDTSGAGS